MTVKRTLLALVAATATSLSLAIPAFARPAVLSGSDLGSHINVRSAPTTTASSPHYGLVGDRVEVLNQTEGSDGYPWYYIQFSSGAKGWVRGDFVSVASSTSATLNGGSPGARVNVRSGPSTQASSPHYGVHGDRVQVLNSTQGKDGFMWYRVRFASRAEGWVRGDLLNLSYAN